MKKRTVFYLLISFVIFNQNSLVAQANYDESKIPAYTLPDLLKDDRGAPVKNKKNWIETRRPEIIRHFENSVYGRVPNKKIKIDYKVINENKKAVYGRATRKEVVVGFSNGERRLEMNMLVFLPNDLSDPAPLFLGLNFYGNHTIHADPEISISDSWTRNNAEFCIANNQADAVSRGVRASRWPVERLIERGYGLATIYYGDIDPDFDDDFQNGLQPLFYEKGQKQPKAEEWGSIATWAWALSRAMDYLEQDPAVNADQVAVIGHSRLGKTSLWAGALDERFALVISNDSGCGGAALSRREFGETVRRINTSFPHWFCKNFHEFNERVNQLPVDQHMLIALMAPRPVYVASAQQDEWADPKGEYLSLFHASPVYRLCGSETLKSETPPKVNHPLSIGKMGYHIRTGRHDITRYDWERYMDFADKHFE